MKTEGDKQEQARQEEHKLLDGKIARHERDINQMGDELKQIPGKVQENLLNFQKELAKLKEQMDRWEQAQRSNPDRQLSPPPAAKPPAPPTSPARTAPVKRDSSDSSSPAKPKDTPEKQPQTPPEPIRVTPPQGKQFVPSDALFEANKWKSKYNWEGDPYFTNAAASGRSQNECNAKSLIQIISLVRLRGAGTRSSEQVSLSTRRLKNIRFRGPNTDFTFIVGGHRYSCPSIIARFLSPRVCEIQEVDATISELTVDVKDSKYLFKEFLSLGHGEVITIQSEDRRTFASICGALYNSELYESVFGSLKEEITLHNVGYRIQSLSQSHLDFSRELKFLAAHFYEISNGLKSLSFSMIYEIVRNSSLLLKDEDSLYDFIIDQELFPLLEFVKFKYLSTTRISDFCGLISKSFDLLNWAVWKSVQSRLIQSIGKQFVPSDALFEANKWKPKKKDEMGPKVSFNGIIAHMTRECGGNVHDCNVVRVTSSKVYNDWCPAKIVADLESDFTFCSTCRKKDEDIPHTGNNWICYDFGRRRIILTHYAIRAEFLRNWVVQVSRDGMKWTEVDRKENNKEMNVRYTTRTFAASGAGACRYVRLVNVGRNWYGNDHLAIMAWEVFGTILEDE